MVCQSGTEGSTKLAMYELCVFSMVGYAGDSSCTYWDGSTKNIYGFYGPIRSLRVRPASMDIPSFAVTYAEMVVTDGTFTSSLTSMSSQKW